MIRYGSVRPVRTTRGTATWTAEPFPRYAANSRAQVAPTLIIRCPPLPARPCNHIERWFVYEFAYRGCRSTHERAGWEKLGAPAVDAENPSAEWQRRGAPVAVLDRDSNGTTLYVRGRDVEELEEAVEFDKATCRWRILGTATEVRRSDERSAILKVLFEADGPTSPADIAAATDMLQINVRQLLFKMGKDGEVRKA